LGISKLHDIRKISFSLFITFSLSNIEDLCLNLASSSYEYLTLSLRRKSTSWADFQVFNAIRKVASLRRLQAAFATGRMLASQES